MKLFLKQITLALSLMIGTFFVVGCSGGEADYSLNEVQGASSIVFISRSSVIVEKISNPLVDLEVRSTNPVEFSVIAGNDLFTVDGTVNCVVYAPNVSESNITEVDYTIVVEAKDSYGKTASQVIHIEFVDSLANITPQIDNSYNITPYIVHDDTTPFTQITAYDPRGYGVVYSLEGTNSDLFEITADGELSLKGSVNAAVYEVVVVVTDKDNDQLISKTDTITLTAVATEADLKPIILSESFSYAENDINPRQIEVASGIKDTVVFTRGAVDDSELFDISPTGSLNFKELPNFEDPKNGSNIYSVQVIATDGNGNVDTRSIVVTVTDVPDAPSDILFETTGTTTISVTDKAFFGTVSYDRQIRSNSSPSNGVLIYTIDAIRNTNSDIALSLNSSGLLHITIGNTDPIVVEIDITVEESLGEVSHQTLFVKVME